MIEELVVAGAVRARLLATLPEADDAHIAKAVEYALTRYAAGASVPEACRAGWLWGHARSEAMVLQAAS